MKLDVQIARFQFWVLHTGQHISKIKIERFEHFAVEKVSLNNTEILDSKIDSSANIWPRKLIHFFNFKVVIPLVHLIRGNLSYRILLAT